MKITLIRKDEEQGTEALSLCDTDAFFEKVKTENKAGHISELREILPRLAGSSARYVHIDKLPRVYPAVEYTRKQKGEKRMKHYNGLVQLEVNRLADLYEVEYVKRQVEQLPQTFAAFCGSSGRSVKIWIRFARTDGSLPTATQEVLLFHAHAYRLAVTCYQPMLPFGITLKEPDLMQSCRMTVDEQPYYNPSSVPFCIEQPLALPDEETFRQRKQNSESAPERMTPGCESKWISGILANLQVKVKCCFHAGGPSPSNAPPCLETNGKRVLPNADCRKERAGQVRGCGQYRPSGEGHTSILLQDCKAERNRR